jgi:hypothetical protein
MEQDLARDQVLLSVAVSMHPPFDEAGGYPAAAGQLG